MFKHLPRLLAAVLITLAFNACAQEKEAAAPAVAAEAGKTYFPIEPAQPTASGDKVEVLEVFSYACIHCAHFQPYADEIKSKLPAYAEFAYMPAIFNESWEAYARAFYTAQSLGIQEKTHQAMFDAVHRDQRQIRSFDDIAKFYGERGADVEKFKQTATSFEVESKLARSRSLVPKFGVDGTPTIIIDGKYRITAASAGGYPQLVSLVDTLVKKAHAERTAASGKK